jgi:hypothetical protein
MPASENPECVCQVVDFSLVFSGSGESIAGRPVFIDADRPDSRPHPSAQTLGSALPRLMLARSLDRQVTAKHRERELDERVAVTYRAMDHGAGQTDLQACAASAWPQAMAASRKTR